MKSIKLFIKYMLVFYIVIASIYWILIRPQHISWGATASEINRKIPGAELISSNSVFSTRAININAAKEKNIGPGLQRIYVTLLSGFIDTSQWKH